LGALWSVREAFRASFVSCSHFSRTEIAAFDAGVRRGEMLALRFTDIDWERWLITLRGATTKSKRTRIVPITTQRFRAVLEWLSLDVEGNRKSDETLVSSNEVGEPLPHLHDTWVRTVLKAHGITPKWSARHNYKGPSPECKAAYRKINLRWHDIRHEYASRLVERNVPLAQVRDLLGHASITSTERYDNQRLENLQIAALKPERGLTFEPPEPVLPSGPTQPTSNRPRESARTKFREFFKYEGAEPRSRTAREVPAIEPDELENLELADWLGVRDGIRNWLVTAA
jgi:hypothetical protein